MFMWLFNWFFGIWDKLPESNKEKIITMIIDIFEDILRKFYRDEKQKENNV